MPSLINSDDGVVSGTSGLKTTGGNDGLLNIQTNGSTAMSINASQQVTFNNGANLPNTFGFKNRIINGAMVIDQRNNGASVTQTTSNVYVTDRFYIYGTAASKFTAQQNAGSVSPPAGFTNYLGITSSSAYTVTSNDAFLVAQTIEGFNVSDLAWGTASAQPATLSFWVRSSLTGTFGGSIATTKTAVWVMPFTYTISSANTWTYITVPIPAATSTGGTNNDNTAGVFVRFGLGSAGTSAGGTAGTWTSAGNYVQPSGTVSVVGTNGATFYITGVQLERGSTATSFDFRSIGTELALCQRYYEKSYDQSVAPGSASTSGYSAGNNPDQGTSVYIFVTDRFAVTKRATATMRVWDLAGNQGRTTQYTLGGLGRTDNANNIFTYTGAQSAAVMIFVVTASTASTYQWDASAEL